MVRKTSEQLAQENAGKAVIGELATMVAEKASKDWFTKTHKATIKPEETREGGKLYIEWNEFEPVSRGDTVMIKEQSHSVSISIQLGGEWPDKRKKLAATEVTRTLLDRAKEYQRSRKKGSRKSQQP